MDQGLFLTTLASGFALAFVHTLIPVHWLPYALAGRARGWSLRRTLAVNAAGGVCHVLVTAVLGAVVVLLGAGIERLLHDVFPWLVVAVLWLLGGYFLYRQFGNRGRAVHVSTDKVPAAVRSDWGATLALVTMLLFSPCEVFVPVYLVGAPSGWIGFLWLTAVLAVATVSCMLVLTALAWQGLAIGASPGWRRWQSGAVGVILIVLGVVMALWHP